MISEPLTPKQVRTLRAFSKLFRLHGRCTVEMLATELGLSKAATHDSLRVLVRKRRIEQHDRSYVLADSEAHQLLRAWDRGDDLTEYIERFRKMLTADAEV